MVRKLKKTKICCPWAALKKLVYIFLQVFGICASPIYQHRIQLEWWLMKKLTPDGARQKLIRISSLAPHTIKLPNVIFENILRVFMWEPQYKIIKFQKMPEQHFLPWFWNAKKKNCSSQHTSNNPENGRQLHQKGYLIIKYPLITKYTHQRRKLYMKKDFWLV